MSRALCHSFLFSVLFPLVITCASSVLAADQGRNLTNLPDTMLLKACAGAVDGPTLAHQLTRTFLSEKQWRNEVEAIRLRFKDWERDNGGDIGRYLNDRLIIKALSAAGGEVKKIQRSITWLAFYKAFQQPEPSAVTRFLRKHQGSMSRLLSGFTWEKASDYVKKKRWREDLKKNKKGGEKGAGAAAARAADGTGKTQTPSRALQVPRPAAKAKPFPLAILGAAVELANSAVAPALERGDSSAPKAPQIPLSSP